MDANTFGNSPGLAAPERHASDAPDRAPTDQLSRTQKDEAPRVQAEGFRGQGTSDSADCAGTPPDRQGGAEKQFLTLRARLALQGYALSRSHPADGQETFFVQRWGQVRELRGLGALRSFAASVGAGQ